MGPSRGYFDGSGHVPRGPSLIGERRSQAAARTDQSAPYRVMWRGSRGRAHFDRAVLSEELCSRRVPGRDRFCTRFVDVIPPDLARGAVFMIVSGFVSVFGTKSTHDLDQ